MINLDNIKRQHREITQLAEEILGYDSAERVIRKSFDLSLLLAKLSGKLSIHLANEDKYIYPHLMSKKDRVIQATSSRFALEMGGLAEAFRNYKAKYLAAAVIQDDPLTFIRESNEVMRAILERINREEKGLYSLI